MTIPLPKVKVRAQKIALNLWNDKKFLGLLLAFLIATAIMMFASGRFSSMSGLDFPQFKEIGQLKTIYTDIISSDQATLGYYRLFFAVDFVWALLLLGLLKRFMFRIKTGVDYDKTRLFQKLWIVAAVMAYFFDVWENMSYLCCQGQRGIGVIVAIKMAGYAFAFILPFISHTFHSNKKYLAAFGRFLRSSYISLIIIAIIGGLMTLIPQGGTIMINLLNSPLNIVGSFLLINFLAVLVSHYPTYFEFKTNGALSKYFEFTMSHVRAGLGIITYYRVEKDKPEDDQNYVKSDTLRRSLGIVLLCTWMAALLYPIKSYFYPSLNINFIFILSVLFFSGYHHWKYDRKRKLAKQMKAFEANKNRKTFDSAYETTLDFVSNYFAMVIFFAVAGVFFIVCTCFTDWSFRLNLAAVLVTFLNIFFFIEFRISRSLLQYIYWDPKNLKAFLNKTLEPTDIPTMKVEKRIDWHKFKSFNEAFYKCGLFQDDHKNILYSWFARWSDNVYYLKGLRWAGLGTLLFFVISNVFITVSHDQFSAINIVSAWLILIYSLITISIKHWIYYRKKPVNKNALLREDHHKKISANWDKYRLFYTKTLPLVLIIAVAVLTVIRPATNNIHSLNLIKESKECIVPHDTYFDEFVERNKVPGKTFYSIASDGGGLKANLWNMLVLNSWLTKDPDTLNAVLSISGVSGGSLGLANFWTLMDKTNDPEQRDNSIERVGNANILSIDAAGLLMRDFVLSFTGKCNDDRSHFAMWT